MPLASTAQHEICYVIKSSEMAAETTTKHLPGRWILQTEENTELNLSTEAEILNAFKSIRCTKTCHLHRLLISIKSALTSHLRDVEISTKHQPANRFL